MNEDFRYYMHDGVAAFSFELSGRLSDRAAREIEQAWRTASSIADIGSLIVDLSYVTAVDPVGRDVLRRWYGAGAKLVASLPHSRKIVQSITGQIPESIAVTGGLRTWLPIRAATLGAIALGVLLSAAPASAADLKPETLAAWNEYVQVSRAQNEVRLQDGSPYLWTDDVPGQAARLRSGEIVVSAVGPQVPLKIPHGLIHDWVGAAFIPNATLAEVLPVVRDYSRYKDFYQPNVIDSKVIAKGEAEDRFSMVLMNRSVFSHIALESDYRASLIRVNDRRYYTVSQVTRVQELSDYGTPAQHALPPDEGTGLIWRLYSVTRFEERDGGVYVELEAVVLSRDIPASLRWLADPIVRRVSRNSLLKSLQQTGDAVRGCNILVARSAQ
jgi:hypothetical protein